MERLKGFLFELFSVFSRLMNVIRFLLTGRGSADVTLSAASHIEELAIERWIDGFFRLFGEKDHCRKWWEWEVQRSRRNIERHEAGEDY